MLHPWVSHLQIWYKPDGCAITIFLFFRSPKGKEKKDTRKRKKDDDHDDKIGTSTKKTPRSPKKHIEVE